MWLVYKRENLWLVREPQPESIHPRLFSLNKDNTQSDLSSYRLAIAAHREFFFPATAREIPPRLILGSARVSVSIIRVPAER